MANVLVADADENACRLYRRVLENREHVVACVPSGESLLAVIDTFKPDIVILDVPMVGMSGFDVCREIRKTPAFHHLPVLMVSSEDREEEILRGFECGADEYILKPIRQTELTTKIDLLLKRRLGLTRPLLAANQLYDNRYLVISLLGQNDDTAVYLAEDPRGSGPKRKVALKILNRKGSDDNFIARFLREIRGLERLDHPGIVRVLDYKSEHDTYYYAATFVAGRSLESIIDENPLSERVMLAIGLQVADALRYLSNRGMVHRDIKPSNIIVSREGVPVIIDFGLAKEENSKTLTMPDHMYGTPQYVSPEYIKGSKTLDGKTDVYSLGVTFYYAVTGSLPFFGDNHMTIFHRHLTEVPPSARAVNIRISQEFSDLIDAMLIKNPKLRIDINDLNETLNALWRQNAGTDTPESLIVKTFFENNSDYRSSWEDKAE